MLITFGKQNNLKTCMVKLLKNYNIMEIKISFWNMLRKYKVSSNYTFLRNKVIRLEHDRGDTIYLSE